MRHVLNIWCSVCFRALVSYLPCGAALLYLAYGMSWLALGFAIGAVVWLAWVVAADTDREKELARLRAEDGAAERTRLRRQIRRLEDLVEQYEQMECDNSHLPGDCPRCGAC